MSESPLFTQTECQGYFQLPLPVDLAALAAVPGVEMSQKTGKTVVSYKGQTIRHQVCKGGRIIVRTETLAEALNSIEAMMPVYAQVYGEAPQSKKKAKSA